ncbi:MAG: acetyl-CoA carboxylase biotin carboxylase subunit [Candidatus Zixiibacteriota bacterium]
MFKKILIANRGEIAIRIIRACRLLDIKTVAVFSDADRGSLHVRFADEAYHIGASPASQSYLVMDRLIEVAKRSSADAIHPGYGFLAESWQFAKLVNDSGLVFIGPHPEAIRLLGDKLEARKLAEKHGVPTVPGGPVSASKLSPARKLADKCGYPVLVKAVAGGGGKGMRIVNAPDDLEKALIVAGNEARSAFGDDRVFIEKCLVRPRHIEIQIACDSHGNSVYLGERECSIQRRHQKLIEEAPSAFVDMALRSKMGETALKAVNAVGYSNVGTVEFLVDAEKSFFFLEVNTRLQVEHPVTELVTGVDLVDEQIRIAAGEKLSIRQEDVKISGHAIECRICAEDPVNDFIPSTGTIISYRQPSGPGVRVDSGIRENSEVTPFYDSLLAKLVTFGSTRAEAIKRMRQALAEYRIAGLITNIGFHETVMDMPAFQKANLSTGFIGDNFPNGISNAEPDELLTQAAAVAAALHRFRESQRIQPVQGGTTTTTSRWQITARNEGLRRGRGERG